MCTLLYCLNNCKQFNSYCICTYIDIIFNTYLIVCQYQLYFCLERANNCGAVVSDSARYSVAYNQRNRLDFISLFCFVFWYNTYTVFNWLICLFCMFLIMVSDRIYITVFLHVITLFIK